MIKVGKHVKGDNSWGVEIMTDRGMLILICELKGEIRLT